MGEVRPAEVDELIRSPSTGSAPVTRRAGAKRRTPEAKPEGLTGAEGAVGSECCGRAKRLTRRGLAGPCPRGNGRGRPADAARRDHAGPSALRVWCRRRARQISSGGGSRTSHAALCMATAAAPRVRIAARALLSRARSRGRAVRPHARRRPRPRGRSAPRVARTVAFGPRAMSPTGGRPIESCCPAFLVQQPPVIVRVFLTKP